MKNRKMALSWLIAIIMTAAFVLSGCGLFDSDDDDDKIKVSTDTLTITGTAAAGLPIVGYVKVKGASGNVAYADIEPDGSYELDVSSLTAPYVLQAKGTVNNESISLYSTGMTDGTINITPITNYIANRILDDVDEAFENWTTASSTVDTAAIQAAETVVQKQLSPILEAYDITDKIDLMCTEFNADQSGLDAVLDILDIAIDSSNEVTITNKATGTSITGEETFSESEGTALVQVISETAAMNIIWSKLTQVFADEKTSLSELNEAIAPLMADDFLDGGWSRDDKLDNMSGMHGALSFVSSIGRQMTSSEFAGDYTKGYWLTITGYVMVENQKQTLDTFRATMVYNGSNWLWYGDQMWFDVDLEVVAMKRVDSSDTVTFQTGIRFEIDMNNNYAYNTKGVRSLIVTRAGLPSGGLVFQPDTDDEKLNFYNVSPSSDSAYLLVSDTDIAAIPENAECTVSAYSTSHETVSLFDTPLISYTVKIKGKPYLNAELSNATFPIFTSHTTHSVADLGIGTQIPFTWTLPTDADVGWKNRSINIYWGNNSEDMSTEKFLDLSTVTSTTLDTTTNEISSITYANLSLEGYDVYGRYMTLDWEYN